MENKITNSELRKLINTKTLTDQEKLQNLLYVLYYPDYKHLLLCKNSIKRNFVVKEIKGNIFYNEKMVWMYNEGTPNKGELIFKIKNNQIIAIVEIICHDRKSILEKKSILYSAIMSLLESLYKPNRTHYKNPKLYLTNSEYKWLLNEE